MIVKCGAGALCAYWEKGFCTAKVIEILPNGCNQLVLQSKIGKFNQEEIVKDMGVLPQEVEDDDIG